MDMFDGSGINSLKLRGGVFIFTMYWGNLVVFSNFVDENTKKCIFPSLGSGGKIRKDVSLYN